MKKSITVKVIIAFIISIYVTNLIYMFLMPYVLNMPLTARVDFWKKMLFVVNFITLLATIAFYLFFRPIKKIMAIADQGQVLDAEQIYRAEKSFKRVNNFLFISGALFYFLGLVANVTLDIVRHIPIEPINLTMRFFAAISFGVLNGLVTARFINIVLIEAKLKMNIVNLQEKQRVVRYESTFKRVLLPSFFLFLFAFTFSGVMAISYIRHSVDTYHTRVLTEVKSVSANPGTPEWDNIIQSLEQNKESIMSDSLFRVIIIQLIIIAITVGLFSVILYEVQSHIKNLRKQIDIMSAGNMDLTQKIHIIGFDDIGIMTSGINQILEGLQSTFQSVRSLQKDVYDSSVVTHQTVEEAQDKASHVESIIREVDSGTKNQVEVIEKTVGAFNSIVSRIESSIERISSQTLAVEQTSVALKKMLESFNQIIQTALHSEELFKDLVQSIENGSREIINSLNATQEISQASGQVAEMIKVISEIAEQSNVLALNAAIEASHAGSFGKGFSIVAEEVRKLAHTTADSARNVEQIIADMREKNEKGVEISQNLNRILQTINHGMGETGKAISNIAESSKKQAFLAQENLNDIDNLLQLTHALRDDAEAMRHEDKVVGDFIGRLNETTDSLTQMNERLVGSMGYILESYERLNKNFEISFASVSRLEKLVAAYKME